MRLVYCIHSLHRSGGMERVLTLKANYWADVLGYDVHIVTSCQRGRKPVFELSPKVALHDLAVNENLFRRSYAKNLDAVLNALKPDICISLGGKDIFCLRKCTDSSKKMAEFHFSHEKFTMKYGSNLLGRIYAKLRTRSLEKAAAALDAFVVLTESDKKDWEKAVPFVKNIANPLTFKTDTPSLLNNKTCIAVGRLEHQKNFQDAIQAWQIVAVKYPEWTLEIYGSGSLQSALEKKIKDSGLEGKVVLKGYTKDMAFCMHESSILLMTSRFEGFPMTLLEAAESGLPMVSYDCPKGPSELILDGRSGFLLAPGDVEGLADRLCYLMGNELSRKGFGLCAKEHAKNYAIDKIMARWDELFKSL